MCGSKINVPAPSPLYVVKVAECISGDKFYAENIENAGDWKYMTPGEADALGGVGFFLGVNEFNALSGMTAAPPPVVVSDTVEEGDAFDIWDDSMVEEDDEDFRHHLANDDGMGAAIGASVPTVVELPDLDAMTVGSQWYAPTDTTPVVSHDKEALIAEITERARQFVMRPGFGETGSVLLLVQDDTETGTVSGVVGNMDPHSALEIVGEYAFNRE
jgi:hypothetical protein